MNFCDFVCKIFIAFVFHPDCSSRDFPSILSDDHCKHISLATEAPSDSFDL